MAFCPKCGRQVNDNEKFCPGCGSPLNENKKNGFEQATGDFVSKLTKDGEDFSSNYSAEDIEKNKILSLFSYLGILFLVPLLAGKDSPYARFHANQGLILFIISFGINLIFGLLGIIPLAAVKIAMSIISGILNLGVTVLAILGIVNAVQGKAKELPFIGKLFTFVK